MGETGGEAVLCTRDKTFALRNVETSNTVLLIPPPVPVHALSLPTIHPSHSTLLLSVARVGVRVWTVAEESRLKSGGGR